MKASAACRPIAAALALVACAGDEPDPIEITYASDYVLTLAPTVLEGQSPLAGDPQLTVWIQPPDAEATWVPIDAGVPAEGLPPLDAGTRLGLLVEDGGDPEAWEPQRTLAWGETVLQESLSTGEATPTLAFLLPGWSNPGIWVRQGGELQRITAGLAMLPDGRTYVFGGSPSDRFDDGVKPAATRTVQRIDRDVDVPTGPVVLSTAFPESELDPSGGFDDVRSDLTATPFPVGSGWRILVAGGRADHRFYDGNVRDAFVFDADTESFEATIEMPFSRSAHYAVAMANGDVLLDDGVTGTQDYTRSAFVFHASSQTFTEHELGDAIGTWRRAGASLGTEGVLICGGARAKLFSGLDDWEAVDVCKRITLDGRVLDAAPLPTPLAGHAMTALADGRVLVAGGTAALTAVGTPADGSRAAYLYDVAADAWTPVGNLSSPRAGHALVPVPSGGAVVVGGLQGLGTILNDDPVATVDCAERYDPDREVFVTLPECLGVGIGADPAVATQPDHGAFVLGGVVPAGDGMATSTELIGLVGFGPRL